MKTQQQEFKKKCRELFRFLEQEYCCNVTTRQDSYGIFITYLNKTTGVRVSFEPREGGVFVLLSQLISGKVPPYPIFVKSQTRLYSYYLDDIVCLRAPAEIFEQRTHSANRNTESVDKLCYYSTMLRKYASDILMGDFSIFPQLELVVKNRAGISFE